jgi:hypothetical protein
MYTFELSLKYRIAVKERNLEAIISMFSLDAVVITPLKGKCNVATYHEWLFKTVKKSSVKVRNVFQALNGEISIAVLADYEWLMHDGRTINFGGMSVFEFTADKKLIKKMSTFYDTSIVRAQIDEINL